RHELLIEDHGIDDLLHADAVGRHPAVFFFFKQKTAYEIGLGIPAEPLFRSMVNITSSVNSRERSGINTILHELNPLFTINVTMRDIKSKNVYSRVNSKATTQWRKTESANGVHLEGVASDNRSS